MTTTSFEGKSAIILRVARELCEQRPSWVVFFREIFGVEGAVASTLSAEELATFQRTASYDELQKMLASLRARDPDAAAGETQRVITVRLPASVHAQLKAESFARQTSMNRLCVSKLLQLIDAGLVPTELPAPSGTCEAIASAVASQSA